MSTAEELPHRIVCVIDGGGELILVTRGQSGWTPMTAGAKTLAQADAWVYQTYGDRAPTKFEREAARFAAIFGWDGIGADPATWERRERRLVSRARG